MGKTNIVSTVHKGSQSTFCYRSGKVGGAYRRQRVKQPRAVADYNKYMKGVDLSDQLISNYNVLRKTDKFCKTLFFHFIDISVVNAYILFEEVSKQYPKVPELQRSAGYGQLEFREELVRQIAGMSDREEVPLGRYNQPPRHRSENRCSGQPEYSEKCKGCRTCYQKGLGQVKGYLMCDLCQNYFCLNKDHNCFKNHIA